MYQFGPEKKLIKNGSPSERTDFNRLGALKTFVNSTRKYLH